jgi:uncharacterized protein (UPF0261 family)
VQNSQRQVTRVPAGINDQPFATALVQAFRNIAGPLRKRA